MNRAHGATQFRMQRGCARGQVARQLFGWMLPGAGPAGGLIDDLVGQRDQLDVLVLAECPQTRASLRR